MSDEALFGKPLPSLPEVEDRPCETCGRPVTVAKAKEGDIYCTEHDPVLEEELAKDGI